MADTLAWLVENQQLRAENARLRAVLEDLAKAFAYEGGINFHAQPVAYRREQIRKALDG